MGCDISTDSTDVFCHCTEVDNALLLQCVREHGTACHLTIERSTVDAAGIAQLGRMPELRLFSIDNSKSNNRFVVNDDVFEFVARNPSITHLGLMGCSFEFSGQSWVKPLVKIDQLVLDNSDCGDSQLEALLERIDSMIIMAMRGCPLTNHALEIIRHVPSVEKLYLERTNIDDACLHLLLSLPFLKSVTLDGTHVRDAVAIQIQNGLAHANR